MMKEHMTDLIEKCPGPGLLAMERLIKLRDVERSYDEFNWRRKDVDGFDR